MELTAHPDSLWLPLKEIPPPTDKAEADSSPITIVAQDYLDDPPVRDIPETPTPDQIDLPPVCTHKDTPLPPHNTDISHAIAATASAVASSIPLTQLQRSIDMFCTALLAKTDSRPSEPVQTDRYSLRMIEDLDFIKYQLSYHQKPSPAAQDGELFREFKNEINQLKQRLDEKTTLSQMYAPLSNIQQEISSLRAALASRSPKPSLPPTPVHTNSSHIVKIPDNTFASKECQTTLTGIPATSVSIQTTPPILLSKPPRQYISPIYSSSPLSYPAAPLHTRVPPIKLSHLDNKLSDIRHTQRQIGTKPPRTLSLPITDIVHQVVNSDGDDIIHRTRKLVSDKLDSIHTMQREHILAKSSKKENIQVTTHRNKTRRDNKGSDKHEKDPVYIARVYGDKRDAKVKSKQPDREMASVYRQIENIRTQVHQLTANRPVPNPIPIQQHIRYHNTQSVQPQVYRAAKLIRPPRLMPSPNSPSPPLEQEKLANKMPRVIICENAQVQTSFQSPVTPVSRVSSRRNTPCMTSHDNIPADIIQSELVMEPDRPVSTPPLDLSIDTVSHDDEDQSQLLQEMISLQANDVSPGEDQSLMEVPYRLSDPLELVREQEIGRRHLIERVQQMLIHRTTECVSNQVRMIQARERQEREIRLNAAVEHIIKDDVIRYIRTVREELRNQNETIPHSPTEVPSSQLQVPLSEEEEEEYSLSFVSESDNLSDHSSVHSSRLGEEQSLNNTLTPHSTFISPLAPTTPRFIPSPHTQAFSLPTSPHSFLTRLTPDLPISPHYMEVQCNLRDRTLSPIPSSPALSIQTATSPTVDSDADIPIPPFSVGTQCDLNRTPPLLPSPPSVEVQYDFTNTLSSSTPFPNPLQFDAKPYRDSRHVAPVTGYHIPSDDSTSYNFTDITPSTDYTEYNLSAGECIPLYSHRHKYSACSDLSLGEVPPGDRLSPAVEAALLLKNQPSDISPGEIHSKDHIKTPKPGHHQTEAVFSPQEVSSNPSPPLYNPSTPPHRYSPGIEATLDSKDSDTTQSDSEHLSRSVTLSLAFSSPSNKTTTRHRDGVDVFDVSSLEGLAAPVGWEHSQISKGDPSPLNNTSQQPHHLFDTPHLDQSSNSTTCDVHSIDSIA
ncbi:hypothetical protein LOD99_2027 [Oopsacas minuta]|uniref:Uncharacterized protein n=1 Tax=Oopsacas minuta TaxID=111878 RepID=A0AAV7K2Q7_9METZ|nr:hypothetical protein LOD99_2027 [Oopsacas minuta]